MKTLNAKRLFWFISCSLLLGVFILWSGILFLLALYPVLFDFFISRKIKWLFWRKDPDNPGPYADWLETVLFAVLLAWFVRLFIFQAYSIPSSSMEQSLLKGDLIIVSKLPYGPRLPMTPVSVPFVHNRMPFLPGTPSYFARPLLKYKRLRGTGDIAHNDILVFNVPMMTPGENPVTTDTPEVQHSYAIREIPVDRRDNYVKRCVALPGDTLQIVSGDVLVNGKAGIASPGTKFSFTIRTISPDPSFRDIGLERDPGWHRIHNDFFEAALSVQESQMLAVSNLVLNIEKIVLPDSVFNPAVFPHEKVSGWNEDQFGPLWVPAKGEEIELTPDNLPLYLRIIELCEGNQVEIEDEKIYINGLEAETYRFTMDYYFVMGDNRNSSFDSRFWGFVPEDHIIGRATLVLFSSDPERPFPKNIRWKRIMRKLTDIK